MRVGVRWLFRAEHEMRRREIYISFVLGDSLFESCLFAGRLSF